MEHKFFYEIDWKKLGRRQLEAPFKPNIVCAFGVVSIFFLFLLCLQALMILLFQAHPLDTHYFDRAYTKERVRLPSIENQHIKPKDQLQFKDFSYTNPNATPT